MNSFSALLPSTATTSISPNRFPSSGQLSIKGRRRKNQHQRQERPRCDIHCIVISKINCSKNHADGVDQREAAEAVGDLTASPARQNRQLGVAAGKTVIGYVL